MRKLTMGVWAIIRRRWRKVLWVSLAVVVLVNVAVFLNVSDSKVPGLKTPGRLTKDSSHLQVFRKRLNTSSSNSSSLHYVDWDGKDGAFDPVAAKIGINKFLLEDLGNELMNDNNENEADSENFNLEALFFKPNKRIYTDPSPRDQRQIMENYESPLTPNEGQDQSRHQTKTGSATYSHPDLDDFVRKFYTKYQSSKFSLEVDGKYLELLKRLWHLKKRGSRLPSYINKKGTWSWERFHYGIHQHFLYDPEDDSIGRMLQGFNSDEIISIEQKEGGTQIKLILTFENGGQALLKPMRYGREQETLPDHFYFADYERHNAEIAAYHLDKILGFYSVPPTVGRQVNVSGEIQPNANSKLAKTIFISPAGNWCFHGSCSYYCDSSHPICGHPMMVEGSLAAFLPSMSMADRKSWRNPWKRSYSKHRKAYWEVYDDLCEKVKQKHPYNEGRRLLDVLDMSIFDFFTGNLDRHHYETFRDFGNDTFILHLDNGRAFGKSKYDCMSCLAPVQQCCMIRLSTLTKLVKLYIGPDSLSQLMRSSLADDPLNPILWEPHLDALDRRLSKILHVIYGCIVSRRSWDEVIIDDGVT